MTLLNWVHDPQKSIGDRADTIYKSLKDKYPGVKVFVDKGTYDIDFNSRAHVNETKDGVRYIIWIV